MRKLHRLNPFIVFLRTAFLISFCFSFFGCKANIDGVAPESSEQPANPADLSFVISETTIDINATFIFSANGGVPPYVFSVQSGVGSVDASSGVFTAGATPGIATIRVTDSVNNSIDAVVTVISRVSISPSSFILAVNNIKTFTASGGEPPYTFSIQSGNGTIDAISGLFTAPATPGVVIVKVTDFTGAISLVNVNVNTALVISPVAKLTTVNSTTIFSATGGAPPHVFSISAGTGTINPATGFFTASSSSGFVTVRVTDAMASISESAVTVNGPLAISPTTLSIATNGNHTVVGSGGLPPYTFSVQSGGGSMNSTSGDYTAPAVAGSAVLKIMDSSGQSVTAPVNIFATLTLAPQTVTVAVNSTQSFTASGGFGALTFSITNGSGFINSSTGFFTAGPGTGTTDIIVEDTLGNSLAARITIISNLAISPATLKLPVFSRANFSANLGSAPYTFSVFSGTGSVVPATGVYAGGSTMGSDTVRVTDLGMSVSDSIVSLIEPVEITAGSHHFCVRYNEGSVKCWGLNSSGQLGLGDTATRGDGANEGGSNLPFVNLGVGRTAKKIAAGYTHTCAILDDDTVKCWGANTNGQLGLENTNTYGNAANQMGDNLPIVNLGTNRKAKSLSAGAQHTCAILDNDTLKCWGQNSYGQLGRNNTIRAGNTAGSMGDALAPLNLGSGIKALKVAVGLDHTCVIMDDGGLKCFGRNNLGQLGYDSVNNLGDGAGEMEALIPVNLGAGNTAVDISSGNSHTCVTLNTGSSYCWGLGTTGQLGRNNATTLGKAAGEMNTVMSTPITLGFTSISIQASQQRTCAISAVGQTKCWGIGSNGQLGSGATSTIGDFTGEMAALPVINFGTSVTAVSIASAWYSSCVITTNKRIKCFGAATSGALLNESSTTHIGDIPGEVGNGMPWVNH